MKAVSVPGKLLIRFASQLDGEPESVVLKFYTSEPLFLNSVDIHSKITNARCVCKCDLHHLRRESHELVAVEVG